MRHASSSHGMKVLVTGGAGYIGSHTCVALIQAGADVTIFDNLLTGRREHIERISRITGCPVSLVVGDVMDPVALSRVLCDQSFDAVFHFAGLKSISESLSNPLQYFQSNVAGTLNLLCAMQQSRTRMLVFSSSAAVYGDPIMLPICENHNLAPTNPYARSKCVVESALASLHASDPSWRIAALRYFNPVGAHPSGCLGEDTLAPASNLMPACLDVILGRRPELVIYGSDYPTLDGTGVRDFIHVVDLAEGHLAALRHLVDAPSSDMLTLNLGTGHGVSVLQIVSALERASGVKIPLRFVPRRSGDVAACYANVERAEAMLGWRAARSVEEMCADAWRWAAGRASGIDAS